MKTGSNIKSIIIFVGILLNITSAAQHNGYLIVAAKAENNVSIINLKTGKTEAVIPVEHGPHEVAVSPSGKTAAISNYGDFNKVSNSVSIINIRDKVKTKTISLGSYERPHGIEYLNEDELIATCETKMVLLRVNITTETITEVAGTAQSGSHMLALSKTDNMAYVANVSSGSISVIDVMQNKLVTVIPFQPGVEGLDVSPDGKELWVANRNDSSVTVINTSTKKTIVVLHAHQLPFRVKFLPNGKQVAISNAASGNVSVFDVTEKKLAFDVDVSSKIGSQPLPVGITVNNNSEFVYVCTAGYDEVAVINLAQRKVIQRLKTGKEPDGIYFANN
jgi:YVTN family beta-propeller protein